MKRETMEHAGLAIYAELGVILFVFAFILVIARVYFMRSSEAEEQGRLPFEKDEIKYDSHGAEVAG